MSHVRQQLRDRVVTELTPITAFGGRVYSTRQYNVQKTKLPFLNVFDGGEDSEPSGMHVGGIRALERVININTRLFVKATEDVDDAADALAVEVEKLLGPSTLNNLAFDIALASTAMDFDSNSESPVGILTLTWRVVYRTTEGDPETAI